MSVHMHVKGDDNMPGRNHKGPNNEGPMTGRGLGDCSNKNEQFEEPIYGRGLRLRGGQSRMQARGRRTKPFGRNRNR
jgi:hypothetical protein